MSPQELQGKFTNALQKIAGDDVADRNKPIYQRERMTEHEAIDEAAKALRALWKVR